MWLEILLIFIPVAIFICIIVQWIFLRLFLWYLSWILYRKCDIIFKVKVGLLNLKELTVGFCSGGTIEVQNIWLSSSLFNSKYRSILSLCASHIDVKGDVQSWRVKQKESHEQSPSSRSNFPTSVLSFTKLFKVSFQVYNLKILQPGAFGGHQYYVETSLDELVLSVKSNDSSNNRLEFALFLHKAVGSLFEDKSKTKKASVGLNLQCSLQLTRDPLVFQNLQICLSHPEVVLHSVSQVLQANNKIKKDNAPVKKVEQKNLNAQKLLPENTDLRVEDLLVKIIEGPNKSSRILSVYLQDATLKKDKSNESECGTFSLQNFSVLSGDKRLASLVKSNIEAKVVDDVAEVTVGLNSCHLTYEYDELLFWTALVPSLPSENRRPNPAGRAVWWNVLSEHKIQCRMDASDVLVGLTLSGCSSFVAGMMHTRVTLVVQPVVGLLKLNRWFEN